MTRRLDPEIKVIRGIGRALQATEALDLKTRRRVLGWTSEKAYAEMRKAAKGEAPEADRERSA